MSKRENIASNLLTVVSAISSPDIKKATRQPFQLDELSDKQYPAVIIQTSEETREDQEIGSGAKTRIGTIDFLLLGFVKGAEVNIDTKRYRSNICRNRRGYIVSNRRNKNDYQVYLRV